MYDTTLGRFMQRDPKGYVDGMNLYSYVKNNPLKYLDAMGTTSQPINSMFSQDSLNNVMQGNDLMKVPGADYSQGLASVGNFVDDVVDMFSNIDKKSITQGIKNVNTFATVSTWAAGATGQEYIAVPMAFVAFTTEGYLISQGEQGLMTTSLGAAVDLATHSQNPKIQALGAIGKAIIGHIYK